MPSLKRLILQDIVIICITLFLFNVLHINKSMTYILIGLIIGVMISTGENSYVRSKAKKKLG